MLMALERGLKGNKWFSLIDKVATDRTLGIGWQKVQFNAGACGVDGMTVGHFAKDSDKRLLTLREQLREVRYQPQPIRRVHIPKAGSKERRPLGIPTVRDRIVQSAVKAVIEPIFESKFAPNSYGFYPSLRRVLRRGIAKYASASRRGSHGYRFQWSRRGKLMKLVRPKKSKQSLRASLRKPTKRSNQHSMKAIIARINPTLIGWYGYFQHANKSQLSAMDSWVRMRLRSVLRKRQKRKGRGRGRGLDHKRWPNRYFENLPSSPRLRRASWAVQSGTSPGGNHESPERSKVLTGEPCAGDPNARFGGRGGANQCVVPTPIRNLHSRNKGVIPVKLSYTVIRSIEAARKPEVATGRPFR